jgi:RNA polymerase sigma-70 factor, ECF subfamily
MRRDERLEAIERAYRVDLARFLRVALAIVGDRQRAADAVQDAFVGAIRGRRAYRGDGPLEAWLWRAVVNSALKVRREPEVEELVDEPPAPASSNGHHADVESAVRLLPPRQRLVLFLRYYADLDYARIGDVLGIETGTVSATLHAAHTSLRRALQEVPS